MKNPVKHRLVGSCCPLVFWLCDHATGQSLSEGAYGAGDVEEWKERRIAGWCWAYLNGRKDWCRNNGVTLIAEPFLEPIAALG